MQTGISNFDLKEPREEKAVDRS